MKWNRRHSSTMIPLGTRRLGKRAADQGARHPFQYSHSRTKPTVNLRKSSWARPLHHLSLLKDWLQARPPSHHTEKLWGLQTTHLLKNMLLNRNGYSQLVHPFIHLHHLSRMASWFQFIHHYLQATDSTNQQFLQIRLRERTWKEALSARRFTLLWASQLKHLRQMHVTKTILIIIMEVRSRLSWAVINHPHTQPLHIKRFLIDNQKILH